MFKFFPAMNLNFSGLGELHGSAGADMNLSLIFCLLAKLLLAKLSYNSLILFLMYVPL